MIILILFCHSKLQKDATQQLVSTCTVHLWKAIQDIGQAFTVIYNRHIWYIHTVCKFDMVCRCSMLLLWHIRQAISRYPESSQWPCYSRHEAGDTTWSALALRMTVLQNASLYHVYTKGSKGITCLSYFTSQTRLSLKRSEKSIQYIVSQETIFFDQHWSTTWAIFPPNNLPQKDPCHTVIIQLPALSLVSPVFVTKDLHESCCSQCNKWVL